MQLRAGSWLFAVVMLSLAAAAFAADPQAEDVKPGDPGPWKMGQTLGVNLSQSAFSSNWAGGDKGAIVWVANSATTAERQFTRRFNLTNALQLAYGQTAGQVRTATGSLTWDSPDKTTDQILLESVGRITLESVVDPYFALRAESQFQDLSDPLGRPLAVNPIKLKESAGIARVFEKTKESEIVSRLGFGFRQTLAKSFTTQNPADETTSSFTSNDGGVEWQTNVTRPILDKKVLYKGQLLVFQPLFYSKSSALEAFDTTVRADAVLGVGRESVADFWKATDVNFQNTFSAQITKSIQVNLTAQWIYDKFDAAANVDPSLPLAVQVAEVDKNIRKGGQFREVLALGFTYRLF